MSLINDLDKTSMPGDNADDTAISVNSEDVAERAIESDESEVQDDSGDARASCAAS